MKEVVLSETLTAKTVQKRKPLLNLTNGEGILVGGFFGMVGGTITLMPNIETGAQIPILILGAGTYLVSTLFGNNFAKELMIFTDESHTRKSLKATIPSGERRQIGEPKYADDMTLDPSLLVETNFGEAYEVKTFVRNDKGKLSIEHEIKETPLATWKKAFQTILTNENLTKEDLFRMPFSYSFMGQDSRGENGIESAVMKDR